MEQNGNGPKDFKLTLEMLANRRRENEREKEDAKREGRPPVLKDDFPANHSNVLSLPSKPSEPPQIRSPKPNDIDGSDLMTSAEAAKFLGMSVKGLRNLASAGKIPHYKLFGHNRFKKDELLTLLERIEVR